MSVRSVIIAGWLAVASVAIPLSAEAAVFRTTIDFQPVSVGTGAVDPALGDRIVVDWTTDLTSGFVDVTGLTDLTFTLFGAGTPVFVDQVIVGGVFQPFGGVARSAGVVDFTLDIDSGSIALLNNYTFDLSLTTGTVYQMRFIGSPPVSASQFVDGVFLPDSSVSSAPTAITTQQIATAVPAPPTILLLLSGLVGAGLVLRAGSSAPLP